MIRPRGLALRRRAGTLAAIAGAVYVVALAGLVQLAAPPPGTGGGAPAAEPTPPSEPAPASFVRAAHYFAGEWAMNFWTADLSSLDGDLERLKADGFNAFVVAVPWGELQPGLDPIRWDPAPWARLRLLLRAAERHGLGLIARIGYTWDFAPSVEGARGERFVALYADTGAFRAWSAYVARLAATLERSPAFRFAFLTWEDFWLPVYRAEDRPPAAGRARLARQTGFDAWLRGRYSLAGAARRLGHPLRSWADVRVPDRREPAFRLFLDYVDEVLVERVYRPARARLARLSFEGRIDDDPIWAGGRTPRSWYEHDVTFRPPGAPFASTYYAPSIGARNLRDEEPAAPVLTRMGRLLDEAVRDGGGRRVFVDQFVFFDNTPKYRANTKVRARELGAFVRCSLPVLRRTTRGYGVWAARDFAVNGLYNPSFVRGLRGWTAHGGVTAVRAAGRASMARLRPGARLAQVLPPMRNPHWAAADSLIVELWARAGRGRRATVTAAVLGSGAARATVGSSGRRIRLRLPHSDPPYRFSLTADEDVELDDVRLYSFVHRGAVRLRDGRPGAALAAVRAVNAGLAAADPGDETVDSCLAGRRQGP